MNFMVNNQEHFQTNLALHSVHIWNRHDLNKPAANLSWFQKSVYYSGIKISTIYHVVSRAL
jgi:hypothetical protein